MVIYFFQLTEFVPRSIGLAAVLAKMIKIVFNANNWMVLSSSFHNFGRLSYINSEKLKENDTFVSFSSL